MPRNRTLIGTDGLDRLKYEIAAELVPRIRAEGRAQVSPESIPWRPDGYEQFKFEIAEELGIPYRPGYNGDLPAREAGRIGGKIGGNMVRRMIEIAERALASQQPPR